MTDTAYIGDRAPIAVRVPDRRVESDEPTYVYHAARGYGASLLVFDLDDRCIGWIDTRTLGYETAREWMAGVGYLAPREE